MPAFTNSFVTAPGARSEPETVRPASKMVAVAGTHGKTTTTAMIIWGAKQLGLPISYLIGTTLPFAEAGHYDPDSEYFIYEADEYDRNFLSYKPWLPAFTNSFVTAPGARSEPETVRPASLAMRASGPMPVPEIPEI